MSFAELPEYIASLATKFQRKQLMTQTEFEKAIRTIPPTIWENSFALGSFREVDAGRMSVRPFSYVSRCKIHGTDGNGTAYVKLHRNTEDKPDGDFSASIQNEYDITRNWYESFAKTERYQVIKPLFVLPEQRLSATEEATGLSIYELISERAKFSPRSAIVKELERALKLTGGWVRTKNELLLEEGEQYTREDYTDYVDLRLKILCDDQWRKFPPEMRDRILRFIDVNWAQLTDQDLLVTTSHSDFNPGNILIDGDRVTVLDFGRMVTDCHLLDVVKLYHQISLWTFKPQYYSRTIEQLQRALLSGFSASLSEGNLMFRLMFVRNTITHLMTITRFWEQSLPKRMYNQWVMRKELGVLEALVKS